ncbi:hypothetical protein ACL2XO_04945 [Sodalis sp. RH15]|uniref:hypothetical protein n=1 Tax=Sodalis sp. RH15 TaxID=3394330 RepID=UPI0039B5F667
MRLDIDSRYALTRHNAACVLDRLTWDEPGEAYLTVLATYLTRMEHVSGLSNVATRRAGANNIPALQSKIQRLAGFCQYAFERSTP